MTEYRSTAERFWAKVEKGDGCWLWTASVNRRGYGKFKLRSYVQVSAPRVAWMLTNGEVPDGMFVCHTCDNPLCVNPSHLWIGTCADNNRDMMEKGRHPSSLRHPLHVPGGPRVRRSLDRPTKEPRTPKTHCVAGHEYTLANTYNGIHRDGRRYRLCRECHRLREKARYAMQRAAKGVVGHVA